MGYALLAVLLVAFAFLADLNGMLRGRLKAHIDAALSLGWIVLLVSALVLFGWRIALIGFVGSFVAGALLHPLARAVARRCYRRNPGLEFHTPE